MTVIVIIFLTTMAFLTFRISNIDEMDARTKNNVQPRGGSGKSRFPSQMSNGPIPPKNADYTQQVHFDINYTVDIFQLLCTDEIETSILKVPLMVKVYFCGIVENYA